MLYYDKVFLTIQGESRDAGIPTVFIRLYGCPIGCSYCDQPQENGTRASIQSLVTKVKKFKGVKNVCITGGEPLIQEETYQLVYELMEEGYKVSIETSGCVSIENYNYRRSFRFVMDIKCPGSGKSHLNVYSNLAKLKKNDDLKFVICNREDYDFMKKVLKKYPCAAEVLASPVFLKDENGNETSNCQELAQWVLEDKLDVRVQVQLHKIIGVE